MVAWIDSLLVLCHTYILAVLCNYLSCQFNLFCYHIIKVIDLFLIASIAAKPFNEEVARYCADKVNIPYASDNFTDAEWYEFESCYLELND